MNTERGSHRIRSVDFGAICFGERLDKRCSNVAQESSNVKRRVALLSFRGIGFASVRG